MIGNTRQCCCYRGSRNGRNENRSEDEDEDQSERWEGYQFNTRSPEASLEGSMPIIKTSHCARGDMELLDEAVWLDRRCMDEASRARGSLSTIIPALGCPRGSEATLNGHSRPLGRPLVSVQPGPTSLGPLSQTSQQPSTGGISVSSPRVADRGAPPSPK